MRREQEVDRLTVPINRTVEVFPLALDLDVRLVHPPTRAHRALLSFAKRRFQLRRKLLNPAINTGMIDCNTPLRQHFFQVPVAQWVRQAPTNTLRMMSRSKRWPLKSIMRVLKLGQGPGRLPKADSLS